MKESSLLAVRFIAQNTLLEAVRQRLFHFLLVLGCGLVASAQLLRPFNFGASELKFIFDFGFGGIWVFGSILAIVSTVQLFWGELEQRTASTLLAKPVRREAFILGKFCGIAALLALFMALMTALLAGVLYTRENALGIAGAVDYSGLAIFGLLQWVRLLLVAGFTLVIISFSGTFLYAVIVSFFLLFIGQLHPLASEYQENLTHPIASWSVQAIIWLLPNLQLFNVGETVVFKVGEAFAGGDLAFIGLYGVAYTAVCLALTALLFRSREL